MTSGPDHYVQLGTLVLDLPAGSPIAPETWYINQDIVWGFLDRAPWADDAKALVDSVRHLSADEGVRLQLELKRAEESEYLAVLIRCKILPSDAPRTGAAWRVPGKQRHDRPKYLSRLFDGLYDGWDEGGERLMRMRPSDRLSMPEIWSQIPSPPEPRFPPSRWAAEEEVYRRLENLEEPVGVKTRMYRYQFRSLSQMLQMETNPERLVDPLFTPFKESGREGTYWIRLDTWDIQRQPAWYDLPRGGVLCEQMGVGKTLMCLSLVLATLHQPAAPPPTALHITPLVTDVAMSSYPFKQYNDLRDLLGLPQPSPQALRKPTLSELCADMLAKYDHSSRLRSDVPPHIAENADRQMFYYDIPYIDDCMRTVKRQKLILETKKFYLAKTTLVVVPPILVPQWRSEIDKHVEQGALRVLVANKQDLPPIEELITYDVILMNVNRFGMEDHIRRTMQDLEPSVLLQARWKRIILDEGHVAATKTTNAMRMAMSLSCERRWIVSGTPTRHLQQGGEAEIASLGVPLGGPSAEVEDAKVDIDAKPRLWPRNDIEDVTRIGTMIGGFLAAEPFKSDAAFQELVTAPLRHRHGPRFGSIRRLRYLMDAMMVKHRPGEIDTQALLPTSTLTTESLRFEPMQRATYNVLAALVASNVYTSNFTDVDYFLHPRNLDSFLQVVRNLHLACFWYSARDMDIQGCIDRTHKHIETNASLSDEHRERLKEAAYHMERALEMPGWDEWMANGVSVPFEASFIPEPIRHAWSDTFETDDTMIDADSLLCLRRANIPGKDASRLKMEGWDSRARKSKWFEEEMAKKEVHHKRTHGKKVVGQLERGKGSTAASQPRNLSKEGSILKKSTVKDTSRPSKKRKADELEERLEVASHNAAVHASKARSEPSGPRLMPTEIRTKSKCAKVNFVVDTILSSDPADKFVIFGDTFELGHLTEALDLFDVKLCFAGHTVSDVRRTEALQEFQDPAVRVCLLDLRLAARGLNLVAANRMIFLAPVWSRDVQAQAIKRVHRIGQTRPVKVQILVTEGTFEEDILKRYSGQKSDDDEKMYTRAMIENPKFVQIEHSSPKTFEARFTPTRPIPIVQVDTPPTSVTPEAGPSRVRFASPPLSEASAASSPAEFPLVTPKEAIYHEIPTDPLSPTPEGRIRFSFVKEESEEGEERIGRLLDALNSDDEDLEMDVDVKPTLPDSLLDRPFKSRRVA